MTIYVFTGPSLSPAEAREELDAVYLPPVSEGDVYRACAENPTAIGIIDGYFERVPAVWHKEILHAMSRGIHVFGSASMGALRAAELAAFGMEGIGAIFEAYRDGHIEDDDEVAVIHGPPELGFMVLSEAMVNIRRTLCDARADGVISEQVRCRLEAIAKGLFYRDRSYASMFRLGREEGVPEGELERLRSWLPTGRVDQKREDALLMLRVLRQRFRQVSERKAVRYHFEHTSHWEQASRRSIAREALLTPAE